MDFDKDELFAKWFWFSFIGAFIAGFLPPIVFLFTLLGVTK